MSQFADVVSCSDFLFGLLDVCFIWQRSVQCDAKIHQEVAVGYVDTVPADVELFATFARKRLTV